MSATNVDHLQFLLRHLTTVIHHLPSARRAAIRRDRRHADEEIADEPGNSPAPRHHAVDDDREEHREGREAGARGRLRRDATRQCGQGNREHHQREPEPPARHGDLALRARHRERGIRRGPDPLPPRGWGRAMRDGRAHVPGW
ncbi:MAG: hypothetical protein FJZ38_03020 [Candidatus Rokubacteria bacterium]|nr:hypothetical protein [Candidatus Rokubacteria bacterium]